MFDIRKSELDADGGRVIRVSMPVLADHPDEVAKALSLNGPLSFEWEARFGDHEKRGRIDPARARFSMRFRRGVDPDGAWHVRIFATDGAGRRRELWSQLVFVQCALRRSFDEIASIAERYAPIFVFSAKEKYFPVSLRPCCAHRPSRARPRPSRSRPSSASRRSRSPSWASSCASMGIASTCSTSTCSA